MNTLDFSFDDSPWERFLAGRQPGDTVNAAHFLTLLEQETEEAVEDAFAALEAKKLLLDISQLPVKHHQGQAALRLRQEAEHRQILLFTCHSREAAHFRDDPAVRVARLS